MAAGRALVTGAAGFVGSHLTERLAGQGQTVLAIDVRSAPARLAVPAVSYERVDIRDTDRMNELLAGVDTVYHLASVHLQVHEPESAFQEVNVKAVRDLVESSAGAGVRRFIHTSSVGIYGHVEDPPANEASPKRPQTAYERTKLRGEEMALLQARESGLDIVVLRPAWVYGPGCPRTAKLARALRKRRFFYVGDGSNLRHPIHISDMMKAYERAALAPAAMSGRAFIIAGPRYMTLREMVETFARGLGVQAPGLSIPAPIGRALGLFAELGFSLLRRDPPFSRRSLAFFENDNAFDTSAAERDLDFRAEIDLEEGVRLTLEQL